MAAPAPGIGGAGPAPGRGGPPGGIGGGRGYGGGGQALGGNIYSIPGKLRATPSKSPYPFGVNPNPTPYPGQQYWNPYGSVEGFQNYHHPLLQWGRGDVFPGGTPDLTGFPSVPRVQEIANAQNALRGQGLFAPRGQGQGLQAQNPDIMSLLRQRLGMGGGY